MSGTLIDFIPKYLVIVTLFPRNILYSESSYRCIFAHIFFFCLIASNLFPLIIIAIDLHIYFFTIFLSKVIVQTFLKQFQFIKLPYCFYLQGYDSSINAFLFYFPKQLFLISKPYRPVSPSAGHEGVFPEKYFCS